jgi:dihydrofolate reductase
MRINLIVAASANNVIGIDGDLPWRLPDDLQRFKSITMGHPIVMGRLTWESIGRPLPGRQNIVLTRNAGYSAPGCDVVSSPEAAVECAGDAPQLMIIGGGHLYSAFLPLARRIYMTRVHVDLDGDAFFPELTEADWQETSREAHDADNRHPHAFDFITLDRCAAIQSG